MKKVTTIWLLLSLFGVFLFFFLLEELRSHDPYKWMYPTVGLLESRALWNERKWFYFYLFGGSFISFLTSLIFFGFLKIRERKLKLL